METIRNYARAVKRALVWFDRRVIKRYLGVETPLYKAWWREHCEIMQVLLDSKSKARYD